MRSGVLVVVQACLLWRAVAALDFMDEWEEFKLAHRKTYKSIEEEIRRRYIYLRNRKLIHDHNQKYQKNQIPFKMRINKYSDLESQEFKRRMNGYRNMRRVGMVFSIAHTGNCSETNRLVDWKKKGAVTAVKNQGSCGSCWAFSAAGALEGAHFLKTGHLVPLSQQNLIDCSYLYRNWGCYGGLMTQAFQYVIRNEGIDTEKAYPYTGWNGWCKFKRQDVGGTATSYVELQPGNEKALQEAVCSVGPVSVAVDASLTSFHHYSEGVYVDKRCSSKRLDHGVLVVGYGFDNASGLDYWLIKNSWGDGWGEKGYMKLARNHDNMCGVATKASYPVI